MRSRFGVFEALKFAVYLLLAVNVLLFFRIEWSASAVRFATGLSGSDLVTAFAASIDTAAWLVLLILFELETSVFRQERLSRGGGLMLQLLTGGCYALILASFWGYASKVHLLMGFEFSPIDPCSLAAGGASLALALDEYVALDAARCAALAGVPLLELPGLAIYSTEAAAVAQLRLAWLDVINAAAWLGVVAVLAVDVFLQQRDRLTGRLLAISKLLKAFLYGTLALAAIYWGLRGDFVDVWDAVLWLVAFVFIELNLFSWNAQPGASGEPSPSVSG